MGIITNKITTELKNAPKSKKNLKMKDKEHIQSFSSIAGMKRMQEIESYEKEYGLILKRWLKRLEEIKTDRSKVTIDLKTNTKIRKTSKWRKGSISNTSDQVNKPKDAPFEIIEYNGLTIIWPPEEFEKARNEQDMAEKIYLKIIKEKPKTHRNRRRMAKKLNSTFEKYKRKLCQKPSVGEGKERKYEYLGQCMYYKGESPEDWDADFIRLIRNDVHIWNMLIGPIWEMEMEQDWNFLRRERARSKRKKKDLPSARSLSDYIRVEDNYVKAIQKKRSSPGCWTPAWEDMGESEIDRNRLIEIRDKVATGTYETKIGRRLWIEKPNKPGSFRPLTIQHLEDRIVQEVVRMGKEEYSERILDPRSIGFRAHRGTDTAFEKKVNSKEWNSSSELYIVEGDIKSCFDKIRHEDQMICLEKIGCNPDVLQLVDKLQKFQFQACTDEEGTRLIGERGPQEQTEIGTPQGSILSPMQANMVLVKMDRFIILCDSERTLYIRYADDFITGFEDQEKAEANCMETTDFKSSWLPLNETKTVVTKASEGFKFQGFNWIQVKGRKTIKSPKPQPNEEAYYLAKDKENPLVYNKKVGLKKQVGLFNYEWSFERFKWQTPIEQDEQKDEADKSFRNQLDPDEEESKILWNNLEKQEKQPEFYRWKSKVKPHSEQVSLKEIWKNHNEKSEALAEEKAKNLRRQIKRSYWPICEICGSKGAEDKVQSFQVSRKSHQRLGAFKRRSSRARETLIERGKKHIMCCQGCRKPFKKSALWEEVWTGTKPKPRKPTDSRVKPCGKTNLLSQKAKGRGKRNPGRGKRRINKSQKSKIKP